MKQNQCTTFGCNQTTACQKSVKCTTPSNVSTEPSVTLKYLSLVQRSPPVAGSEEPVEQKKESATTKGSVPSCDSVSGLAMRFEQMLYRLRSMGGRLNALEQRVEGSTETAAKPPQVEGESRRFVKKLKGKRPMPIAKVSNRAAAIGRPFVVSKAAVKSSTSAPPAVAAVAACGAAAVPVAASVGGKKTYKVSLRGELLSRIHLSSALLEQEVNAMLVNYCSYHKISPTLTFPDVTVVEVIEWPADAQWEPAVAIGHTTYTWGPLGETLWTPPNNVAEVVEMAADAQWKPSVAIGHTAYTWAPLGETLWTPPNNVVPSNSDDMDVPDISVDAEVKSFVPKLK